VMPPREYMRRCYALRKRGLSHGHTTAPWFAGDVALLERLESADDEVLQRMGCSQGRFGTPGSPGSSPPPLPPPPLGPWP
jgi:hypothetical protein